MSNQDNNKITVKPDITVKASPDIKELKPRAVAGMSEAQLIERNVVGEFKEEDEEQPETKEADL